LIHERDSSPAQAPTGSFGARSRETISKPSGRFRRGDVDQSGSLDLSDALAIVGSLLPGSPALTCPDAADADDSGLLDNADAVFILGAIFFGEEQVPLPRLVAVDSLE